jgi:hypothetical protein
MKSATSGGGGGEGGISWHDDADVSWAEMCDFADNDLSSKKVPGEQCSNTCKGTGGCTHFAWTNYEGGTCWMKKNGATKDQAKKTTEYSVCGIMKATGEGGGEGGSFIYLSDSAPGKTTRYWDCCKVSCGWNGKAPFSAPVQSCAKNGRDAVDVNAANGCDGGPSYACNSNQPWAINDNLAYGFAAAHLTGKSEKDWCCACYELKFTSEAANGKTFVVQVTNTGDDLGENHFDLMIPGGGVGIFNGCTPQWGAPGDGWGERKGGIGSSGECSQLPEELRGGCNWRFDWFKNADNPAMNLRRVKCPAELTQKSNCRRTDE